MRAAKRLSARDGGDVRGGLDAARGAAGHGAARDGEEAPCAWDRDALAAAPCALVPEEGAAVRTDDAAAAEEEVHSVAEGAAAVRR